MKEVFTIESLRTDLDFSDLSDVEQSMETWWITHVQGGNVMMARRAN